MHGQTNLRGRRPRALLAAWVILVVAFAPAWILAMMVITGEPNSLTPPRPASGSTPPDTLIIGDGGAGLPAGGYLSAGGAHVFWFLVIADTQDCWLDPGKLAQMTAFLHTTVPTLQPLFVINTGDLVQSDTPVFTRSTGQIPTEWALYNTTIAGAGLNASTYFDALGNHDAYGDPGFAHYLAYSMSGSYFRTTQFAVDLRLPWGQYAFDFVATPEEQGLEFPFAYGGHLTAGELGWLEGQLAAQAGANLTLAFGHHGPMQTWSERAASGRTFLGILRDYSVAYYGFGHDHFNSYQAIAETAAVETAAFSVDNGTYRIIAVDNDYIASSVEQAGAWPAGLITSPVDSEFALGTRSPSGPPAPAPDAIRCLAWDPAGIMSVEWRMRFKNGTHTSWASMSNVAGPLWGASAGDALNSGACIVEANITSLSGASRIVSVSFSAAPVWHLGWVEVIYLLVVALAALVVVVPVSKHYLCRDNKCRCPEPCECRPCPIARNLFVVKLVAFLALPLAAGLMWGGGLTLAFWWGLAGGGGVAWSDVAVMFAAALALPLVVQAGSLSRRHIARRRVASVLGLVFGGALLAFYLALYPVVGWLAPGLYVGLVADCILARQVLRPRASLRSPAGCPQAAPAPPFPAVTTYTI